MAWIAEDRRSQRVSEGKALLTDEMRQLLAERYFPRYPSKRAVLLPALHMVQHEYNWIPTQAIQEIAEFLEIAPAEALDTASFYEEYWLKPKGKYLVQVCRSIACELCQSENVTATCRQTLGIDPGETTADGRFTLVELECLGACGSAPVVMINETLHENVTESSLKQTLASLPEDPQDYHETVAGASAEAGHGPTHGLNH